MARPKKKPEITQKAPFVQVSFRIGQDTYNGEGETIAEALASMPMPPKIFIKSYFKVSKGNKTFEQTLPVPRARRLFMPISRNLLAKQYELLLK